MPHNYSDNNHTGERKIRVLVITMGGARQQAMEEMLAAVGGFHPPTFSPGVSSRDLRNRCRCLQICHEAGLIPAHEWQYLQQACTNPPVDSHAFFDCLATVPVKAGRRGSPADVQVHYCVELWRKAKTLNRGRSVLACLLAHLIAMRTFVTPRQAADDDDDDEGPAFDVLLEDNVRAPLNAEAARRIQKTITAVQRYEKETGRKVHMRYFGWLGSRLNLQWNFDCHLTHRCLTTSFNDAEVASVAPFPTSQHVDEDLESGRYKVNDVDASSTATGHGKAHSKPGGTPVWGAYAYWISKEAYEAVMETLRNDVGALMWKMKNARHYTVKPIDKILPRIVLAHFGSSSVVITKKGSFFRAPMLSSKIHAQWDAEFCSSTTYQLTRTRLSWSNLWLTEPERRVVEHYQAFGEWISPPQFADTEQYPKHNEK